MAVNEKLLRSFLEELVVNISDMAEAAKISFNLSRAYKSLDAIFSEE